MSVRAFLIPILFLFSPRFCKSPPKGPILNTCHLSIYPSIIHPSIHPPSKEKNWVAREKLEHSNSAQFQFNQALSALRNVSFFWGALRTILCGGLRICFFVFFSLLSIQYTLTPRLEFLEKAHSNTYILFFHYHFFNPKGFDWRQLGTIFDGSEAFGVQKSYSSFFFVIRRGYYPISII